MLRLTSAQTKVLAIAGAVVLLMLLYPPWQVSGPIDPNTGESLPEFKRYAAAFAPPRYRTPNGTPRVVGIHWGVLLTQVLAVGVCAAVAYGYVGRSRTQQRTDGVSEENVKVILRKRPNYGLLGLLFLGAFGLGVWARGSPDPWLAASEGTAGAGGTVPMAKVVNLFVEGHRSGYDRGYGEGYTAGWNAMREKALEIVSTSAAAGALMPQAPLVIQRSEDEEAILKMQRQRMEREDCVRRYKQFSNDVPSWACQ